MNTDITASTKPEYPVIDRNPPFTKVVGNFNFLDYCRFATITGVSVTVGYLSDFEMDRDKARYKGTVDGYWRIDRPYGRFHVRLSKLRGSTHGFFPNEGEVDQYQKHGFNK
ncbi:hypothetical protein GH714_010527 [Hevea brasiliensis]|uniref:NADH-ubiquinone oxidoreductase 21kDa subunit N-terminal domain-containing protein n=1 Tax=Hevea brasiliensis TaxID=3981 RepID=A0A6A6LX62_HEVBR|nr:hypothetical protein GH714_010527 [Hevea brasiliensis]